jgi:fumarylpyruvate hydrolase
MAPERRADPTDGWKYTLNEFQEYYGNQAGVRRWEAAKAVAQPMAKAKAKVKAKAKAKSKSSGGLAVKPPRRATLSVEGGGRFPVRRIYCVGRNYWDHAIEMGKDPEREPPFFFSKPSDAAVDVSKPGSEVPYPPQTSKFHFEGELVICIGKSGRDVPVEQAMDYVWGYGVGVDLTRRDLQEVAKKMQRPWDTSKGFDFSGPVGALVPKEKVGDLPGKMLKLSVNGEEKQKTDLDKMIWKVDEQVSFLSKYECLEPGDIIFSGTPAGVGALVVGDTCEVTVDSVPTCSFKVAPCLFKDA